MRKRRKSGDTTEGLLRSFRGIPKVEGVFRGKEPHRMNGLMDRVLMSLRIEKPRPEAEIGAHWSQIVGEIFAGKCAPERLADGGRRLMVMVSGSAARQELAFRKQEILRAIRRLPGCGKVRELSFVSA